MDDFTVNMKLIVLDVDQSLQADIPYDFFLFHGLDYKVDNAWTAVRPAFYWFDNDKNKLLVSKPGKYQLWYS